MSDAERPNIEERVVALGPVRHACHACGTCCTGWSVRVAGAERPRIERHAAALGVAEPFVGDFLRRERGACVFLGADKLCRIHATFGGNEKPLVCQVFPRMSVRAEDFIRIGADPGCSSTWRTFADGPQIAFDVVAAPRDERLSRELAETEMTIIRLAAVPKMTVPGLVGIVAGQQGQTTKFPPGFVKRMLRPLKNLGEWLTHEEAGPILVGDFAAVTRFITDVDLDKLPKLTFADDIGALVLETLQRTLFLRIGDAELPPMGKVVLHLAGALACAYVHPRLDAYGPALAAWSRLSRLPGFWKPVIPDVKTARYLMTGER